jgi:hypothetical protein
MQRLRTGPDGAAQLVHSLLRKGLLLSTARLFEGDAVGSSATTVETVGILTKDRPAKLAACVESLLSCLETWGHVAEILIVDDSTEEPAIARNRSIASAAASRRAVRYCGLAERRDFADQLVRRGLPAPLVQFAIQPSLTGASFGAIRNVLQLDTAGRLILSVDDDTVPGRAARHPKLRAMLDIVGHGRWFDYWFFESRGAADAWASWEAIDVVGEHNALLGRPLAACMVGFAEVGTDRVCSHLLAPQTHYRVVATMPGKVGASGRVNVDWLAWLEGGAATFEHARSNQIAEMPPATGVAHFVGCMATMLGIDNRSTLPPFFPFFRDEDGVFGATVRKAVPDACWGLVPHSIWHDGYPGPAREDDSTKLTCAEALLAALEPFISAPSLGEPAENVTLVGHYLQYVAAAGAEELRSFVAEGIARRNALRIHDLAERLEVLPREARQRATSRIECDRASLLRDDSSLTFDERGPLGQWSWNEFRDALALFGQLMSSWRDFESAAMKIGRMSVQL